MKIEKEIKGEIFCSSINEFYVKLKLRDERLDWFELDLVNKEIQSHLEKGTQILLGISTYDDYIRLIKDLGLKLPVHLGYKEHWTPTLKESTLWYFIDSKGQVGVNSFSNSTFDNELVANFNIFPNKELAEKSIKSSKLGRLILLWQYANDCLFEPDWLDGFQYKYYIIYDSRDENACYDYSLRQKSNNIHFETSEQVKAFVEMYKKEIKDTMEI